MSNKLTEQDVIIKSHREMISTLNARLKDIRYRAESIRDIESSLIVLDKCGVPDSLTMPIRTHQVERIQEIVSIVNRTLVDG